MAIVRITEEEGIEFRCSVNIQYGDRYLKNIFALLGLSSLQKMNFSMAKALNLLFW
jgi:hypothetical protein